MRAFAAAVFLPALLCGCSCDEQATSLGGDLGVSTTALDFGLVAVRADKSLQFTVQNSGSAELTVALLVEGEGFALVESEPGAVLSPSAEAAFTVSFAPGAVGPFTGKVLISSDAESDGNQEIALTGTGIAAAVVIAPDDLDFGDWPRDRPDTPGDDRAEMAGPLAITVENTGSDVLTVTAAAFTDDAAGQFAGELATLVGDYQPGELRSADVTFSPAVLGEVTGGVRITTGAEDLPEKSLALRGRGIAPVLRLCTSMDDDPAGTELCLKDRPEDYAPGDPFPALDFGAFDDLTGRAGKVTLRNEGNVPLQVSSIRYSPASDDIRLWEDAAHTVPLDLATFKPKLCPPGELAGDCTADGEVSFFVDYLARGSKCCYDFQNGLGGDQLCVDLAGGDCRTALDSDEALVTVLSTDKLFGFVTLVARGRSRIPVIVVSDFNGDLFQNDTFFIRAANSGETDLRVTGLSLWDPAGARTCAPDGSSPGTGAAACSCAADPTITCAQFTLLTAPPLDIAPGGEAEVELQFTDPNPGRTDIELHFESTDPIQPIEVARLVVNGRGIRP